MDYDKLITYQSMKNNKQIVLKCTGIDDTGFIMQPPDGSCLNDAIFGKLLTDSAGIGYKIKSIDLHQNIVWLIPVE